MADIRAFKERLVSIESKVDYIKDNMAHKSAVSILKWAMGGIATIALTALLLAAKGGV